MKQTILTLSILLSLRHLITPQIMVSGQHRKVFSGSAPVNSPASSPVIFTARQPVIFVAGKPVVMQ